MPSDARASFTTDEIIRVLEAFGIKGMRSLADVQAGSRRAAKLVVVCASGQYLLKRREVAAGGLDRMRYAAEAHQYAAQQGVLCARLMSLADGSPLLVEGAQVYELQQFVDGQRFSHRHEQASAAGAALARFHGAMQGFRTGVASPVACYTRNGAVVAALRRLESSADDAAHAAVCRAVRERYERAAAQSVPDAAGVTHSDYHPGNVLFDGLKVTAIIDFDSAREAPLVTDLANAALQWALPAQLGTDPARWDVRINEHSLRALVRGYRAERQPPKGTSAAVPPLMIQAAIAEVAAPVARRGTFGTIDGRAMLAYLDRKTGWIEESANAIATLCR